MQDVKEDLRQVKVLVGAFLAHEIERRGLSRKRLREEADMWDSKISEAVRGKAGAETQAKVGRVLGYDSYRDLLEAAFSWATESGWTNPGYLNPFLPNAA